MKQRFNVYGIGNAIMDLQLRASDDDLATLQLKKGGMQLVEAEEQAKILEYFDAASLHQASGGSAANTIIGLAQLGASVGYGCLVGDDLFGNFYRDEMSELGVHLDNEPVGKAITGTSLILITPDAERTMNTNLGVSAEFSADHISADSLCNSDWLYVEGYLFSSETGQQAVTRAIEIAKENGVSVAVSFSDGFIVDVFGDHLRAAVESADLLFANMAEAQAYTKGESEDEVFASFKAAAPTVIMTLHERGARVNMNGEELHIPAFPVDAVDTTGAGDMFAAGFLYGLTGGFSAQKSAELACFLASRVVSQLGPRIHGDLRDLAEKQGLLA